VFANDYHCIGNPYFDSDGHAWDRRLLPSDLTGYCPDDLVTLPKPTWDAYPDSSPLTADDARTLLWLFAGDVGRAARYYKIPPQRLRAFIRNSPRVAADYNEARERILDMAEAVLFEALFSDDKRRRDSAARYVLTKSKCGRSRFHALTDHLEVATSAARHIEIRWLE
jgi:hypothetical protein